MPNKDEDKHEAEYESLFAIFQKLIQAMREHEGEWETLEELMEERANIAIKHAFDGFGMDYEDAIELIRNANNLTDEQRTQRDVLTAAIDNLVDFSVVEEYHLADELADFDFDEVETDEDGEPIEYDEDDLKAMFAICHKYNHTYAWTENMDIEYAMIVAAGLCKVRDDEVLMYMTMGDERVRPWHLQYEGFTAPKSSFPAWLVPPIEHQCRCYLISDSASVIGRVHASVRDINNVEPPYWFNPTFKECVAFGGRIFSDEHPYFQVEEQHLNKLTAISTRIKNKYFNG